MDLQLIFSWLSSNATGLSATFAAVAAAAAWRAASIGSSGLKNARTTKRDDELLIHAAKCLERAHAALTRGTEANSEPAPDRFNWLLCARLIEDYKEAKEKISSPISAKRCLGEEDYWRYKMRDCLEPTWNKFGYYSSGSSPIYPTSAIVIHAFVEWPAEKPDPMDQYSNTEDAFNKLGVSQKWAALRQYINKL